MRRALSLGIALLAACGTPADPPAAGPTVRMDFSRRDGFFTAPFPSD